MHVRISTLPLVVPLLAVLSTLAFPAALAQAQEGRGGPAAGASSTESVLSTESTLAAPGLWGPHEVSLSLAEAIRIALANNADVRVLSYNPRMSLLDVTRQQSQFDPSVSAGLSYSGNRPGPLSQRRISRTNFDPPAQTQVTTGYDTESAGYQAGVGARNTLGGTLSLTTDTTRVDSTTTSIYNDGANRTVMIDKSQYYQGTAALTFTQPLLRNAGAEFNKSSIRIASNNASSTAYAFEDGVMNLVTNTIGSYWRLVLARENLKVLEKSLEAARDLLRNNTIKYDAGALPKVEVTRARARVAEREVAIVNGNAAIKDAEDQLRRLLDSDKYALLSDASIIPQDEPSIFARQLDVEESVHRALVLRPDVKQQIITIESYGIIVARARNQTLPALDLQATYKLNSYGDSWDENFDAASQLPDKAVNAGLFFRWPLGNRAARSDYAQARFQRLQALASLEVLQRNVTLSVKKAVRDVATSLQQIDANRIRLDAARENLDAEVQKYEVGQSISLDVLDAQDKLQQAASDYNLSLVNFTIAMANYHRVTGEILRVNGVKVVQPSVVTVADQPPSQ